MLGSLLEPLTYTIHLWVDWSFSSRLSGGMYLRMREKGTNSRREWKIRFSKHEGECIGIRSFQDGSNKRVYNSQTLTGDRQVGGQNYKGVGTVYFTKPSLKGKGEKIRGLGEGTLNGSQATIQYLRTQERMNCSQYYYTQYIPNTSERMITFSSPRHLLCTSYMSPVNQLPKNQMYFVLHRTKWSWGMGSYVNHLRLKWKIK